MWFFKKKKSYLPKASGSYVMVFKKLVDMRGSNMKYTIEEKEEEK